MIQNNNDIREWAGMIVEAKGEKFTPLTKGEQFLIAKYIIETSKNTLQETTDAPDKDDPKQQEHSQEEVKGSIETPVRTVKMTRGCAYHRAGLTAQETFDKFLENVKNNASKAQVMDFSTGRRSTDAAFAYWLSETIEVDLQPSVRPV